MEPEKKHKYLPVLITIFVMLLLTVGAVAGVWYYMDKQAEIDKAGLQEQINESNKPNVTTDTTAQTEASSEYTNKEGKYSFNLTTDTIVSEGLYGCEGLCGQSVEISKKQSDTTYQNLFITIGYHINPNGVTLNEILNNDENYKNGNATNIKDFTIGGVTGKSYSTSGMAGDTRHYHFIKNNTAYSIVVSEFNPDGQDAALNEILKTFKFN